MAPRDDHGTQPQPRAADVRGSTEEAGRGPAEEPAVAKEFGGSNYGVEAIWRKPGRWAAGSKCRGISLIPQSTTGHQGRRSEEFPRHEVGAIWCKPGLWAAGKLAPTGVFQPLLEQGRRPKELRGERIPTSRAISSRK